MLLISHRGNINGANPLRENNPAYIHDALKKGYQVELDAWYHGRWWLGHDKPQYIVKEDWLCTTNCIWVHCKNREALEKFATSKANGMQSPIAFFWHDKDDYTLVSNGIIWTFPGKSLTRLSICVAPEKGSYTNKQLKSCEGICSDNIEKYKYLL